MNRPDVDWQVAAHLAVFEKLLCDLLVACAADNPPGWLAWYRQRVGTTVSAARFPIELTADEQLEWKLHSEQLLDRMFGRAEAMVRDIAAQRGAGDAPH
jgi:hypothetical protein